MAVLELHVTGPGVDARHALPEGGAELVLGRDAQCDVALPDPQRTISRRHLAVSCRAGALHFRVLSVVNGVDLPSGEVAPGGQGELPAGQTLALGDYRLSAAWRAAAAVADDPWAELDGGAAPSTAPEGAGESTWGVGAPRNFAAPAIAAPPPEDDPFTDWSFETGNHGRGAPGHHAHVDAHDGGRGVSADMAAFFRGLGLDPLKLGAMGEGEVENTGRVVRAALEGLFELHGGKHGLKQALASGERTMLAPRDDNPLRSDWPLETKLQYLLGGRTASVGFVSPHKALDDFIDDLHAHDQAVAAAARAALEGTVREFEPEALKAVLLGGKGKAGFLDNARLWDTYSRHYAQQSQRMAEWLQRLFDKHFTGAYARESSRLKRKPRSRG